VAEHLPVGFESFGIEADEGHQHRGFMHYKVRAHRRDGDPGCFFAWKAVNSRGDGGKCDIPKSPGGCDSQARPIAAF